MVKELFKAIGFIAIVLLGLIGLYVLVYYSVFIPEVNNGIKAFDTSNYSN